MLRDRRSERRTAAATGVPERQKLDAFRIGHHPVVDVVANAGEVETTNARQGNVRGASADFRLD